MSLVVSVTWAGETWRLAAGAEQLDGADWTAMPGLVGWPHVEHAVAVDEDGWTGSVRVSLALLLPLDVAAAVAAGWQVALVEVEVALVEPGAAWSSREVLAAGSLLEAQYDIPGRPSGYLAGTVEDTPISRSGALAVPEVGEGTWVGIPDQLLGTGAHYPWVAGYIGGVHEQGPPAAPVYGTTGVLRLMLGLLPIEAEQVVIVDQAGETDTVAVEVATDTDGVPYAVTEELTSLSLSIDRSYGGSWTWRPVGGHVAGLMGAESTLAVAFRALAATRTAIELDWGEVLPVLRACRTGRAAYWSDDPELDGETAADDILGPTPWRLTRGRAGWRLVTLDPRVGDQLIEEEVRELANGGPWERVTGWQAVGRGEVPERIEVTGPRGTVTLDVSADWLAAAPRRTAGLVDSVTYSAGTTPGALWTVAAWRALRARGFEAAAWRVPSAATGVRVGSWVRLEDGRPAVVSRIAWLRGDELDITLARPLEMG